MEIFEILLFSIIFSILSSIVLTIIFDFEIKECLILIIFSIFIFFPSIHYGSKRIKDSTHAHVEVKESEIILKIKESKEKPIKTVKIIHELETEQK